MISKRWRRKIPSSAKRRRRTFWKWAVWNIVSQGCCFLLLWGMCEADKVLVGCKRNGDKGLYMAEAPADISAGVQLEFTEVSDLHNEEVVDIKHGYSNGDLIFYVAQQQSLSKVYKSPPGQWQREDLMSSVNGTKGIAICNDVIYWTNQDTISKTSISTKVTETFISNCGNCWGIEIDKYGQMIYWADQAHQKIRYASLSSLNATSEFTSFDKAIFAVDYKGTERIVYYAQYDSGHQHIKKHTTLGTTAFIASGIQINAVRDIAILGDMLLFIDKTTGVKVVSKNGTQILPTVTGLRDCEVEKDFYRIHAIESPRYPSSSTTDIHATDHYSLTSTTEVFSTTPKGFTSTTDTDATNNVVPSTTTGIDGTTETNPTDDTLTTLTPVSTDSTASSTNLDSATPNIDTWTTFGEVTTQLAQVTITDSENTFTIPAQAHLYTYSYGSKYASFDSRIQSGDWSDTWGNTNEVADIFLAWEVLNSEYPDFPTDVKQHNYENMDIWLFEGDNDGTMSLINEEKSYDVQLMFPDSAWEDTPGNTIVASVLTTVLKLQEDASDISGHFEIGSHVLSLNPYKEKIPYAAKEPFCFTISILSMFKNRNETVISWCQFLTENGKWSPEGCSVKDESKSHVTCCCNHMTSFAVLMQLVDIEIPRQHQEALAYVTYVAMSMSIICLIATIILYIVCKLFKKQRVIIHINLAVSLILAQLIFVTGVNAKDKVACTGVTVVLHYLWLVVFMWMLVEGIHLYLKVHPSIRWRIKLPIWAPIAWGVPAVIAFITFGIRKSEYGNPENKGCWLPLTDGLNFAFSGPALVIIVVSTVILIIVLRKFLALKTNQDKNERERMKAGVRAMCFLLPVLGVTWIFGVLQLDATSSIVFSYLFNVCNGLQGVFIFITQGLLDEDVKMLIKKKLPGSRRVDVSNNTDGTNDGNG